VPHSFIGKNLKSVSALFFGVKMNHSFNVEIATIYGVQKAILVENIAFWINKNMANKSNFNDGKYWTYNSGAAFLQLFPYFTSSSISRWLVELENCGVLLSSNYNRLGRDKTKWYTILDHKIATIYNLDTTAEAISQNERSISQNERSISQNERTLPYINPNINSTSSLNGSEPLKVDVPCDLSKEEEEVFEFLKNKFKQKKDLKPLRDMAVKHGKYSCMEIYKGVVTDIKMNRGVKGIGVLLSRLQSRDRIEPKKKAPIVVAPKKTDKPIIEGAAITNYIEALTESEKLSIHRKVFEKIEYEQNHLDIEIIENGVDIIKDGFKRTQAALEIRGEVTALILNENKHLENHNGK